MNSFLSESELNRYSRHLLLPEIGVAGQERLKKASVLIVGAGGLGSPVLLYLAAAGVGKIGIVDFDKVERSNLQRQIVYIDDDVEKAKAVVAASRARNINPELEIVGHNLRLDASNAMELFANYQIIVDGSDNFATRYLVNDACVLLKKPNVHGAIYRFEGQASVFSYAGGPCYRCLFPEPPAADAVPNCAEAGVLGVIAGIIGCIQANETLKLILEIGESLSGKLLLYDSLSLNFDSLPVKKSSDCPCCGISPEITELQNLDLRCKAGEDIMASRVISPRELKNELNEGIELLLLDVRTYEEVLLSRIQNSRHIPLSELPDRFSEIEFDADIVVYCKSGVRSAKAVQMLVDRGYAKARNLAGGILAWARDVEPGLIQF